MSGRVNLIPQQLSAFIEIFSDEDYWSTMTTKKMSNILALAKLQIGAIYYVAIEISSERLFNFGVTNNIKPISNYHPVPIAISMFKSPTDLNAIMFLTLSQKAFPYDAPFFETQYNKNAREYFLRIVGEGDNDRIALQLSSYIEALNKKVVTYYENQV